MKTEAWMNNYWKHVLILPFPLLSHSLYSFAWFACNSFFLLTDSESDSGPKARIIAGTLNTSHIILFCIAPHTIEVYWLNELIAIFITIVTIITIFIDTTLKSFLLLIQASSLLHLSSSSSPSLSPQSSSPLSSLYLSWF